LAGRRRADDQELSVRSKTRLVAWEGLNPTPGLQDGYFFSGAAAFGEAAFGEPAFGAAAFEVGSAPSTPSARCSSSLAFFTFLPTIRWTRTWGRAYGLQPSVKRSSFCNVLMRSPRVSTLRARASVF